MPQTEQASGRRKFPKWARWAVLALGVAVLAGSILLAVKWPFSRQSVTESIEEVVSGTVRIGRFRNRVFPDPGCEAYDVSVTRPSGIHDEPALITVQKITIAARYPDLFLRPGYIARIILNGLRVHVPPRGSGGGESRSSGPGGGSSSTRVGEIRADGAVLEIGLRDGQPPLTFDIHTLLLKSVSRDKPFSYTVSLTNALPPGEITASGRFGPWNTKAAGETPVSGSYKFEKADLSVFSGISGMLSSEDTFTGQLDRIDADGSVQIPNFAIKSKKHEVPLQARYQATVNGINGDVFLHKVDASFLHTDIVASGDISSHPGKKGKITSIRFEESTGRVEDVLWLFDKDSKAPMDGALTFRAEAVVVPEGRAFLREATLRGHFNIAGGVFTSSKTQANVNDLSKRARGEAEKQGEKNAADRDNVTADMLSDVALRNGVATLTNLFFSLPGARAHMEGTYDLFSDKVDFHGSLKTEAKLSQTTGGWKSVLLKPLNPLFKKKNAGADVPVEMTGTYDHPHFGFDINPVHKLDRMATASEKR
jgi:hypothetical protein